MVLSPLTVVLLSGVVGMGVAFLVWLHRDRPGAGPLAVFVVAASLWAVTYGIELAVPGLATMERLVQVQLTLSVIIPVAWLVTVIEYTGHPHWLTQRRTALLLIEPAVFVTLVWSNHAHELIWSGRGTQYVSASSVTLVPAYEVVYWGHMSYILLLILAGGVLLLRMLFRSNQVFQGQGLALLLAIAVPTVVQTLFVLGVLPTAFDPTSLGYVASGAVLSVAILRGQLLDVAPVTRELGREAIFTEMDDMVIIVDDERRIVDINAAATALLDGDQTAVLGRSLSQTSPTLAETVPGPGEQTQTEMALDRGGSVRYYDVRVIPLYRAYGVVSGHLISLRDITDRRQREQRLDVLNRLLRHDIRNEMNVVKGNADLLRDTADTDERERLDRIISTVDDIVDRSNKIGRVTEALETEQHSPTALRQLLESVVSDARDRHPDVAITLTCEDDIWIRGGPSVLIALEELVENAVEHQAADADRVTVEITATRAGGTPGARVAVHDNGPGITDHEREVIRSGTETPLKHGSGVGLWLVNWIVRNLGGRMSFPDTDESGTTVELQLPTAEPAHATDDPVAAHSENAD
ncbi:PAS domain-containing sensor histidine kinase [Haloarcula taiwanensis]|uniref:histidine kinase n=1 Tax=Haloarcula taiwanensis TaxID=1932004 RepID=A0A2H4ZVV9_9EURY|nr:MULTISPECIES: histidine kinase N-terminal 7TM domain-containing protein [Haloarcula]AUG46624.1 PAS domain-containing sensor histidine kinase [Haloarcula taiwanensis]RLM44785.1 PAS domain S-box protein [Haloarcula sp. Atlit-47R]RLN01673.1 PAS domain S-box protein [Haloarcula sp. Atlit-7R]